MEPFDIDWGAITFTDRDGADARAAKPRVARLSGFFDMSAISVWCSALTQDRHFARLTALDELLKKFSPGERLALYGFTVVLGLSTLILLVRISAFASVEVPADGGVITEGEVTPARFVNPVLAVSQADQDIAALVYSGLMRAMPDGTFVPDLARSYSVSSDGTVYTFTLRDDVTFHDGQSVTADDVLYTVSLAQNPDVKSLRRADWESVSVSSPDAHTVVFTLPHAYAPFIENATMGILPKHAWGDTEASELPFSTLNTHPIGTGPFKMKSVKTDSTGAVTRYDLVPFARFALGKPHLSRISFAFFDNSDDMMSAYNAHHIDSIAALSPADMITIKNTDAHVVMAPLPRVFGVFFNVGKNAALADASARAALDAAVDKPALIATVLNGFGAPLSGPIPPGVLDDTPPAQSTDLHAASSTTLQQNESSVNAARALLTKGGWSWDDGSKIWTKNKTTLSLKLATADSPELVATAQEVAKAWRAAGVEVAVQIYPLSEFNNTILRPREYESILFGEVVGRDADLFAFWHSSQRNDPGLNLALYANTKTDAILSQARTANNERDRAKLYRQFAETLAQDTPATFLYAPTFLYIIPSELKGVAIGALTAPSERFLNVYQWYTETQRVWEFFAS